MSIHSSGGSQAPNGDGSRCRKCRPPARPERPQRAPLLLAKLRSQRTRREADGLPPQSRPCHRRWPAQRQPGSRTERKRRRLGRTGIYAAGSQARDMCLRLSQKPSAKLAWARPVAAFDNDTRRTPRTNVGNDGACSHKMADRSEDRRGPRGNLGEVPARIHATDERG